MEGTARSDGRRARSERSRIVVADAMLALIDHGALRPTAAQIADAAGVSLRLVHHHFRDREALFAAAAERQNQRMSRMVAPLDAGQPFPFRLGAFAKNRSSLLERITPVRRAALAEAVTSAFLSQSLGAFRKLKRQQTVALFATELAAISARHRGDTRAALCAATSWSAWEELRSYQALSLVQSRRVLRRTIAQLLGQSP